jgi:hypothetical protein
VPYVCSLKQLVEATLTQLVYEALYLGEHMQPIGPGNLAVFPLHPNVYKLRAKVLLLKPGRRYGKKNINTRCRLMGGCKKKNRRHGNSGKLKSGATLIHEALKASYTSCLRPHTLVA